MCFLFGSMVFVRRLQPEWSVCILSVFFEDTKIQQVSEFCVGIWDKDQILPRIRQNSVGEKIDAAIRWNESGILLLSQKEHDWPRNPMFWSSRKGVFGTLREEVNERNCWLKYKREVTLAEAGL